MAATFLKAYREAAAAGAFLPTDPAELEVLLDYYLMKRAVNELRHELTRRPERVAIPVAGLLQVLEAADAVK
jgi:maltose alpha-D-glucosyltransferase/alpha-amylase